MVLQNRTSKWWRRVDAVTRLGDLRDPVALPALKAFLDDTDLDVQRAAQNAIEQIVNATAEVKAVTPVSTTATALAEDETQPSVLTAEQTIEEARVARKAVKIVVTGPSAFLRRQFINSISEIDVLSTERAVSPQGETVSLDYGQIMVDDDLAIYLFGSPGEREYDFIWEVLSEGMLGFVVLVDSTQPNSFRSAKSILNNFAAYAPVPYIVAADNSFRADAWPLNDIGISLRLRENVKILSCASLDHDSVKNILLELIYLISETNDYDSV
jgi:signal recognition particle receptor subunit beta